MGVLDGNAALPRRLLTISIAAVDNECTKYWAQAGVDANQCCPFGIIILSSVGSVVACIACMALALYIWQPRMPPSLPTPSPESGPVRIVLPDHLNNHEQHHDDGLDIRIYPPPHHAASAPQATSDFHYINIAKKSSPAPFSRREFESAAESIHYFTSDPPSSHRPSGSVSMFQFSEVSSEASHGMSSIADMTSSQMWHSSDEQHETSKEMLYSQASFFSTNKTFKPTATFNSGISSLNKPRRQNTSRRQPQMFRTQRSDTTASRLPSDADSSSLVSSTIAEVPNKS
ncbi:hypothetical protein LEN26_012489 [Aphanomyces euteiches]|nr:hypothetical protein Ae201684P_015112 [Aphanomyces euteiches]KAH9107705.1 hypothetical protein AeMF1_016990 [Aphanomyces euteiches]KAH9117724.1 hypothetical protein LEN26_012489 [Aphanomyces euteiches]KAH9152114.1 hypothetical protein AeRB84_005403 [Aphanomyces euteiches]KAH9196435.1 hypothetical protein AeNC1_001579 [Aphanomyces euteiches]